VRDRLWQAENDAGLAKITTDLRAPFPVGVAHDLNNLLSVILSYSELSIDGPVTMWIPTLAGRSRALPARPVRVVAHVTWPNLPRAHSIRSTRS
jgi:hypothetical protein